MPEQLDQQVFLFLNSLNSPLWDKVMYTISQIVVWVPLYLAIILYLGFRYKKKSLVIFLFIILAVTFTDQTALLIKIQSKDCIHVMSFLGLVHLVKGRCGESSDLFHHMPQIHSTSLLSLMFIRRRWYSISIIIWATLVGFSRIYLGVHAVTSCAFNSWRIYRVGVYIYLI
jgi:undecaprenyl-diphosphatase